MAHRFRFTLIHLDTSNHKVISEPEGWNNINLILERDKEFHGVFELFEVALRFYGNNGEFDGGLDFLNDINDTWGVNAQIHLLTEISEDGVNYEDLIVNLLDIQSRKEIDFRKVEYVLLRDDFWAKFKNRYETPVDIESETDLYGEPVSNGTSITASLISQKILKKIDVASSIDVIAYVDGANGSNNDFVIGVQFDEINLLELELFTSNGALILELPDGDGPTHFTDNGLYFLKVQEITTGNFECQISYKFIANRDGGIGTGVVGVKFVLKVKSVDDGTITEYTFSNDYTDVIDRERTDLNGDATFYKTHYLNITLNLNIGDEVYLYGDMIAGDGFAAIHSYEMHFGENDPTFLKYTANTLYPTTEAEGFFIHDIAGAVTDRITGETNTFYSEYLGGLNTIHRSYDSDGCEWNNALVRGLQIRQYTLSEKPFSISFKQWWEGSNPIFNLGLSTAIIGGKQVIRVEQKAFFYNDTPILYLSFVNNIEESYDKDYIFKKVKIGYKQWQSESSSGIDDPQTNHEYASLFKTVGNDITIQSDFIAAGLAIETTRRTTKIKSSDYKFDDNTFIIALNPTELSSPPNEYEPELDENFDSITNLLSPETRYNSRLTPARNFLRWANYLFCGLQKNIASVFKFTAGEGNYDMTSEMMPDGCPGDFDGDTLSEKQDIIVTEEHLFTTTVWSFKFPLSYENYKLLRDNPTMSIAVSESDTDYTICHRKRIEYDINKSLGTFTLWVK
jgi:hypothetical protein